MGSTNYFNKNLLKLIEFYDITSQQLARKLNVSEDKITAWLNASAFPTYNQLIKLADCFKRPIVFFFMETPPVQSFEIDFRSTQGFNLVEDKKRLSELIDSVMIYKASLQELFIENPKECKLHEWVKFNYSDKLNFYNYLRAQLNFDIKLQCQFKKPTDVVEYLREQFFNCGIYIFKDSFRIDNISGLCAYDADYPIILINNKVSFTRQLFTIFHELYHLMAQASHIDLIETEERDCDRFAGEFLVPVQSLLADIEYCEKKYDSCENYSFIEERAAHYNISREAYLFQLLQQKAVSEEFFFKYKQENKQYLIRNRQDDIAGGNYYFTKMNYLGKSYLGEIITCYFTGKIPLRYVAQFTQMKVPNVKKMLTMMSGGRY
ncbi:MAG: XRE family transcriptional regulator [Clostridiales bacterium]|nr:XRE family transcriptional regulator [Clostridiales bacterium]